MVTIADAMFRVSAAGVRCVQNRQAREVVAFFRGVSIESGTVPRGVQPVRFCPYRGPSVHLEDGTPVSAAAFVILTADGSCWAVDPI